MMLVGPRTNEVEIIAVLCSALLHQLTDLHFGHCHWHLCKSLRAQLRRNFFKQRFNAADTNGGQHFSYIILGVWNKGHWIASGISICNHYQIRPAHPELVEGFIDNVMNGSTGSP